MTKAVDVIYDFIPATGQPAGGIAGRKIVSTANCNELPQHAGRHSRRRPGGSGAGFHGGSRNNVDYCVVCHTEQRKYGRTEATLRRTNTLKFTSTQHLRGRWPRGGQPAEPHPQDSHGPASWRRRATTMAACSTTRRYSRRTLRNCTEVPRSAGHRRRPRDAQGDNWKNEPSRLACGACHDGINFDTGVGRDAGGCGEGLTSTTTASTAWRTAAVPADDGHACATSCHNTGRRRSTLAHSRHAAESGQRAARGGRQYQHQRGLDRLGQESACRRAPSR